MTNLRCVLVAFAATAAPTIAHGADRTGATSEMVVTHRIFEQASSTRAEAQDDVPTVSTNVVSLGIEQMSDRDLWTLARIYGVHLGTRIAALMELTEREEPTLAAYIGQELGSLSLNPTWQAALLIAAERAPVTTAPQAAVLCEALLRHAIELDRRNLPDLRFAVWAATRRVGALAGTDLLPSLLPLLASNAASNRQAALQAVTSIAHASDGDVQPEVQRRTLDLAERYTHPDELVTAEMVALAANAVRAAIATDPRTRPALRDRIALLDRPALLKLCADSLAEV